MPAASPLVKSWRKEDKMADKKLKITLVKSPIGCVPKHKKIIEAMVLRKLQHSVELPDNASTRGMIRQVGYLLKVEE